MATPPPVCRYCFVPVLFAVLDSGRKVPINPDGSRHALSCPAGKGAERPPDDICLKCRSSQVRRLPGKGSHWAGLRCLMCGAFRNLRRPDEVVV